VSNEVASPDPDADQLPASPFVFATVGTDHHPYDRLVSWMDAWSRTDGGACFVQYGTSAPPVRAAGARYLAYPTMVTAMRTAAAVVAHGGPATIMLARQCGRLPIVVPRDPARGEHVDDHQSHFAAWLEKRGQVAVAHSAEEVARHLDLAAKQPARYRLDATAGDTAAAVARFRDLVEPLMQKRRR
jgi:UDP-N-acetylglucosamine transferase subunit ALG13